MPLLKAVVMGLIFLALLILGLGLGGCALPSSGRPPATVQEP